MTELLHFSLIFVTLVVLAAILFVRLTRYERYLRAEKEGIQRLNEKLQSLADGMESLGTQAIEDQLREIHEVLSDIRDNLKRPPPLEVSPEPRPEPMPRPVASLVDVVENKLYNLGYRRVHVVGDLVAADATKPVRVVVEAEKEGVLHKGHLVVHGRAVTELEMQPSYTSFP